MRSKGSMPGKNLSQAQQDAQYRAIFLSPGRSLSLAEYRYATYLVIGKVCTLLPFRGIKVCASALQKVATPRRSTTAPTAISMYVHLLRWPKFSQ